MSGDRSEYLRALGVQAYVPRDTPQASSRRVVPVSRPPEMPSRVAPVSAPAADVDVSSLDWGSLREQAANCRACALCEGRGQSVFGTGDTNADWLIVGEAPGAEEDRQGEPFVGRAGLLLNAMLKAMGRDRQSVYIANILKCRPPQNRDPKIEEAHQCRPFLDRQIALLKPSLIIAVGRIAAQRLLDSDQALGKLRGQVHHYGETDPIPLVVTYHPAYLLRSPGQKRKAWEDLLFAHKVAGGQVH